MSFDFISTITSCVKYCLFTFNLAFVITGIILISVGAGVQAKYSVFSPVLDSAYWSVPALLIAIGVIIFIVAFFGCCGAIKENYCMTFTFSILLIIVFILELAAGISGYVLRNKTYDLLTTSLQSSITFDYGNPNSTKITEMWDDMQRSFQCCGVEKPDDWPADKKYPISCCNMEPGIIGEFLCNNSTDSILFKNGCIKQMSDFVSSHAGSLGAAGICIAILQFIGILAACYLVKRSKNEYIP